MAITQIIPGRVITSDPLRGATGGGEQTRDLTVNPAMGSGTETDFPALVNFTANNLRTTGNGGLVTSASGHDIRLFASDGSTLLNWEVQSYNAATGNFIAWVRIPSMTTSTAIKIKYGNAAITTFQGGATGSAWNSGYARVWHMQETLTAAGQTMADSTSNAAVLTLSGASTGAQTVAGKVGNAYQINKTNSNYFSFANLDLTATASTMEGWVQLATSSELSTWWGRLSANNTYNWFSSKFRLYSGASDLFQQDGTTSTGTWYHYMVVRNGTDIRNYTNGVLDGFSTTLGAGFVWNQLGRQNTTSTLTMLVSHPRISQAARSANYALWNYNTQQNFSTFWSLSSAL